MFLATICLLAFTLLPISSGNPRLLGKVVESDSSIDFKIRQNAGKTRHVRFPFPLKVSVSQLVKSPQLIWSSSTNHVSLSFSLHSEVVRGKMYYDIQCAYWKKYRVLKFERDFKSGIRGRVDINRDTLSVENKICLKLFDYNFKRCVRFRVKMKFVMSSGRASLLNIDFGSSGLCSQMSQVSADCDFSSGDCGFRNDACGLVPWKVADVENRDGRVLSSLKAKTNRPSRSNQGWDFLSGNEEVSLAKTSTTNSCMYTLCIPCLQTTGFDVTEPDDEEGNVKGRVKAIAIGPENSRDRRGLSDYGLFLDPDDVDPNVAIGVFKTPSVIYHEKNAFLRFAYVFYANGLHQISVGAVCTSDVASTYYRLDSYGDFNVNNFQYSAYALSGRKCLNLHRFVSSSCESFSVVFTAGAIGSQVAVDSLTFHDELPVALCGQYADNL
eukprot:m.26471 g.26471  ORF g.26471 m.26471 type:complete len:439 (+) comp29341_c0_seq2:138-1454(+)